MKTLDIIRQQRVVAIRLTDKAQRESLAEACFKFTPKVAVAGQFIFLDIQGCQKLYSEATLVQRIRVLLRRFQVEGVVSVANDLPTAKALSIYLVKRREDLPIEALQIYAHPFHEVRSLDRVTALMKSLGLSVISDVFKIPRRECASRFGKESLLALQSIEHAERWQWPQFLPTERVVEAKVVDESFLLRDLEPLVFVLRGLLDRLLLRLRAQGKNLQALSIKLTLEKNSLATEAERVWQIEFSFPLSSMLSLLAIVRDRLSFELQKHPLLSAVIGVEVVVERSVVSAGRQTDFFSKREEEKENFLEVVERLTQRLGEDRAFMAQAVESYVPERSWRKVRTESSGFQFQLPLRPLRILKRPQEIVRKNDMLICQKRIWNVLEMTGPERISGEWWLNDQERDYYRVRTDTNEELWVFTLVGEARFFLHGVFD